MPVDRTPLPSAPKKSGNFGTLLGFAVRSRKIVLGFTAVLQACRRRKIFLLIVDDGASSASKEKIIRAGQQHRIPVIMVDALELEKGVGKINCRFAGITDPEFARSMISFSG